MNSQFYLSKILIGFLFIFILTKTAFTAPADFDSTFGTNGKVVTAAGSGFSHISKIIPLVNGKILAVGSRNNTGSQIMQLAAVRYNANGTLDTSFSGDEILVYSYNTETSEYATTAIVQPDGKILISSQAILTATDAPIMRFFALRQTVGTFGKVPTMRFKKFRWEPPATFRRPLFFLADNG